MLDEPGVLPHSGDVPYGVALPDRAGDDRE